MQGILKTPLYKNTAYCPHLVEHCTFSGYGSEQRFFGFTLPYSNVETRIGKTIFWLDKNQSIEKLKSEIQLPLDKTVISKENKILKQELDKRKRKDDFLFERIGRVVYKDNWIPSRKAEKLSQQELLRYHKQWYQNPMIWVVDSEKENNVVQRPLWLLPLDVKSWNIKEQQRELSYYGKKYRAFIRNYSRLENYVIIYFLDWLYDVMALYEYRYKGEDYYFPSSTFFQYNDYVVFTYAQSYSVSKKFYEQAKEYFLAQQGVLNELALAYEMYREQIVMVHQVKHVVQWITKKIVDKYIF